MTHAVGRWQVMLDGSEMAFITYFDLEDPEGKLGDLFSGAYSGENQLGFRDVVTGLQNVAYLRQFSNERLKNLREAGCQPVLLYVDVISLHKYNQQYGYTKGDELMRKYAVLLKKEFPQAMIGRGTDDHFIVIDTYKEGITEKIESVNQNRFVSVPSAASLDPT